MSGFASHFNNQKHLTQHFKKTNINHLFCSRHWAAYWCTGKHEVFTFKIQSYISPIACVSSTHFLSCPQYMWMASFCRKEEKPSLFICKQLVSKWRLPYLDCTWSLSFCDLYFRATLPSMVVNRQIWLFTLTKIKKGQLNHFSVTLTTFWMLSSCMWLVATLEHFHLPPV